mgnify:CR=1 FL=1
MFAIAAAVLAAVGFAETGAHDHTSAWLSPQALGLAALACIGLHLIGVGTWPRK